LGGFGAALQKLRIDIDHVHDLSPLTPSTGSQRVADRQSKLGPLANAPRPSEKQLDINIRVT
jgi:hypothetical protein